MKVSDSPKGMTESYAVKFWHVNEDGFHQQDKMLFYSNSKSAHKVVESFALKRLRKTYKDVRIVTVTYQ